MNGLHPIIRRVRRPLLVVDAPQAGTGTGEAPAPPRAGVPAQVAEPVSGESPDRKGESPIDPVKTSDAKVTAKRSAR